MAVLVECVPNVSEGRRGDLIARLGAVFDVAGVSLLNVHSDVDHHRSVFTVVGAPGPLLESLEELYALALAQIDLRDHRGVHPRLGAVDVCPFVPLSRYGSTMGDCIELARALAERVGGRFDLPVYLYREAATRTARQNLAPIRRGQFEGLGAKLADPEWLPDCGPNVPHATAGATIIGARDILIAFNVVLAADDIATARAVAATVRESGGGLPGVRALGVRVPSRAIVQVSMNIEDPSSTPLRVVVDRVRQAAEARGVGVRETELVGLMPLASAADAAASALALPALPPERLLENAVAKVLEREARRRD